MKVSEPVSSLNDQHVSQSIILSALTRVRAMEVGEAGWRDLLNAPHYGQCSFHFRRMLQVVLPEACRPQGHLGFTYYT